MTRTAQKYPTKTQAKQAAASLTGLLTMYQEAKDEINAQRVSVALDLTRQASQSASGPQRAQLMGFALLCISQRAAANLLAQKIAAGEAEALTLKGRPTHD